MNIRDALKIREIQWAVADQLAEDRLPRVNAVSEPAKVKDTFYTRYGKRTIDFVIALLALTITLPVNLVIGIVTFFDVGAPILFKQQRTGKDGKSFTVYKFRNMRNTTDEKGQLLPPQMRVTKWGKLVRKTSMDELLNFWSVLRGDMSLIGPRPLPPQYLHRYSDRHRARLAVRPGLECPPRTGKAAEVRSWQAQFENDVWYVENVSLKTDVMMLIRLIQFALDSQSSAARAEVTRGSFVGYSEENEAMSVHALTDEYAEAAIRKKGLAALAGLQQPTVPTA